MERAIMEQMAPQDNFLRKADRAADFSLICDLCAPLLPVCAKVPRIFGRGRRREASYVRKQGLSAAQTARARRTRRRT